MLRTHLARLVRTGASVCRRVGPINAFRLVASNPRRIAALLRGKLDAWDADTGYQLWLDKRRLTPGRLQALDREMETFTFRPVISILMPVFNIERKWLVAAVRSVQRQRYPHWELCVVDDASTAVHIRPLLDQLASGDPRVKVLQLVDNVGIAGASNRALGLSSGEFIGLLDHDDTLAPDALFEIVRHLNRDRTTDLVYTDHDIRDGSGRRIRPFFKPDWSPDLLLSMNYVTHFCVYRRTIVDRVGGFRPGFEGSQDYDLLLRVTEQTDRIAHIAQPLYSWSQAPASVATNPLAKPHAHEAGHRALDDALKRRGIDGEIVDGHGGPYRYRVKRRIAGSPLISIVIPTRDNCRLLEQCIRSIVDLSTYRQFEIVVVDNQSVDPRTLEYLRQLPHRVLRVEEPFNFALISNAGAAVARGDHLVFLNDDTQVIAPGWLESMLEHAQRPEVGAVGACLLFPNNTIQHAGVVVGIQGKAGHAFAGAPADYAGYFGLARVIRNYSAVTGACLMTRRAVFDDVGGFDEAFEVSYNDVDLCLRVRRNGYLVVYTPYALLYHHQSASRGPYNASTDRKYEDLLRQRWGHVIEHGDPYYNHHLTASACDFSLRLE